MSLRADAEGQDGSSSAARSTSRARASGPDTADASASKYTSLNLRDQRAGKSRPGKRKAIQLAASDHDSEQKVVSSKKRALSSDIFPGIPGTRQESAAFIEVAVEGASAGETFPSATVSALADFTSDATSAPHGPKHSPLGFSFPDGALRLTRTPGRADAPNTISLDELIDGASLVSACIFAFFIAQDELFDHLPFTPRADGDGDQDGGVSEPGRADGRDVPIYIGRDASQDPLLSAALKRAQLRPKSGSGKLSRAELERVRPHLAAVYTARYGANFNAFYPHVPGCAHTKLLLLEHAEFLRVVVTSANLMDADTRRADNHWFVQDLPRLRVPRSRTAGAISSSSDSDGGSEGDVDGAGECEFETLLLEHLEQLSCPAEYIATRLRGRFDFSRVRVHFVASRPGTHARGDAERYGLLRLWRIVRGLATPVPPGRMALEYCAGSIGNVNARWLNGLYACAEGRKRLGAQDGDGDDEVPPVTIVFPTTGDVRACPADVQDDASNVGCHLRPWKTAPMEVKRLFRHYRSKDTGRLFHMKLLMALDKNDSTACPKWIYIGSANLSQSAWGALTPDARGNASASGMKLEKISNMECGVIIPGDVIDSLIEDGVLWEDGVVPYVRPAEPYNLKAGDKAWNDPRWVTGDKK